MNKRYCGLGIVSDSFCFFDEMSHPRTKLRQRVLTHWVPVFDQFRPDMVANFIFAKRNDFTIDGLRIPLKKARQII